MPRSPAPARMANSVSLSTTAPAPPADADNADAKNRSRRHGCLLRFGRAARRSGAARQAGGGCLARRTLGGVRGLVRGAQVWRALGDAGGACRTPVPARDFRPAGFFPLSRRVETGVRDFRAAYRPDRAAVAGRGLPR